MSFVSQQRLRFGDCDPAGMAYFPRLLALVDNAVEDWLVAAIGHDRAAMHVDQRIGLPTIQLQTGFSQACRLGETLDIAIIPTRLGATSITLDASASVAGKPRFAATLVQVLVNLDTGKPRPWPAAWRACLDPCRAAFNEASL
jgi:4-hydroxybenzoyl-CoA thioesterase